MNSPFLIGYFKFWDSVYIDDIFDEEEIDGWFFARNEIGDFSTKWR